ncbi:MAG: hypothetical protein DI586_01140 [Micavibrio aeruginosavorus]|uniref:Acyltransferase 3 domain-containing protein n=1 Tax=Micavibrio aeruginosavorus TaxID=349221 RepID=A0A2W5HGB9_9BACT|nr:MAG: hypothetical protein DI586_01140 [Micavibrio aeruginosavorus]
MLSKALSSDITSYDLIKAFAVIIMIVDHTGYYFFPDEQWWRAIGRIGFPVWFFLVGYSSGRGWPVKLLAGAAILTVMNFFTGLPIFPLNALVTIMIIRLLLDHIMNPVMKDNRLIWPISLVLICLIPPSYYVAEYGTQAIITAIFGYLVRHREKLKNEKLLIQYMFLALISFVLSQQMKFGFNMPQFAFMALGTMVVRTALLEFKPKSFPELTGKTPFAISEAIRFMGRRTLEIYIGHLILFKMAALLTGDGRFEWFRLSWV